MIIMNRDFNSYIVAEPGRKFKLRYSATKASSKNPIMAEVMIDGQFDHTYRGIKSRTAQVQYYFVNATRDKKLEFVFSNSVYDDSSSTPNDPPNPLKSRGGVGAMSVYFYKACSIPPRQHTTTHSPN